MISNLICVIDDDSIYQIITKKMIHRFKNSYQVVSYPNGYEAINQLYPLMNEPIKFPDIILLDIEMPIMDGWNFLIEFEKIRPLMKKMISVYIVSSSIAASDKEKSKEYNGIISYLTKPITLEDLKEITTLHYKKAF